MTATTVENLAITSHLEAVAAFRGGDLDAAVNAVRCREAYLVELALRMQSTIREARARVLLNARSVAV